MIKNYFIIGVRNLLRQSLYSFINLVGLTVGLTCFILMMHFVQHEFSYDKFYDKHHQIYRIVQRFPGYEYLGSDRFAPTSVPLASALVGQFPEVISATTMRTQQTLLSFDGQSFYERVLWADAQWFDVFNIPLSRGEPETVLSNPNSIILTETLARKIFGELDPIGKFLTDQNQELFEVTGLLPEMPANSSLQFTCIASIQSLPDYIQDQAYSRWDSNNWHTFFTLADGSEVNQVQAKMPQLVQKFVAPQGGLYANVEYLVQSLSDAHLHSNFTYDIMRTGNITVVYLFAAIAVVILLLACVNYVNLAVARSIKRTREVGLRKVIGARHLQLILQFLGESVLLTSVSLFMALVLVELLLPFFGDLVERNIQMEYFNNWWLVPGLLMLAIIVGVVSGSYPAFFMASLRPAQVLKGGISVGSGKFRMQKLLIIAQYGVSIALATGGIVIYQQMKFVQHKEMGYERENILTVSVTDNALRQNYSTIRQVWLRNPAISGVTAAGDLPIQVETATSISQWEGSGGQDELDIYRASVDYDFLDVFEIELVAGRNFSREYGTDSISAVLVNETAARAMGWTPSEAVGKHFRRRDDEKTIVGVVKDFHMHSLHLVIQPLMIQIDTEGMRYFIVKLQPVNLPQTIGFLESSTKQFSSFPFEYHFMNEYFDRHYKEDLRLGKWFGYFAMLALLIAALGMFGLAAFSSERRVKELGIRKVLGASVSNLVALLTKDFLLLVAAAFLLFAPVAWYIADQWLQEFAYRIQLHWWMFSLAGGFAFLIAIFTTGYQSVRAALNNPVSSLRSE